MKLRITVVHEIKVTDLNDYRANDLEQAAKNQQAWIDNGEHDIIDCIDFDKVTVKVEAVKE